MNEKQKNLLNKGSKVILYILLIYIIFLLAKSLWTNYDLKNSVEKLQSQIATLQQQKKDLENLNIYYQSDAFKELEARRKLGMKRPDEQILIISTPPSETFSQELEKEKQGIAQKTSESQTTGWRLWWEYFTK
ncbi:MAG: Septum formation initiator [Candidatus Berkelbacteria bacterium]|nr:Septum formation initiator [Candidatus Berkelbacteria bacterium]